MDKVSPNEASPIRARSSAFEMGRIPELERFAAEIRKAEKQIRAGQVIALLNRGLK